MLDKKIEELLKKIKQLEEEIQNKDLIIKQLNDENNYLNSMLKRLPQQPHKVEVKAETPPPKVDVVTNIVEVEKPVEDKDA